VLLEQGNGKSRIDGKHDDEAPGLVGWAWSGVPEGVDVGDVHTVVWKGDSPEPQAHEFKHPNGVDGVDHVVLRSGDLSQVKASFAACGVEMRRERADVYPGITQLFYRPSEEVIIEVVGPTEAKGDGQGGAASSPLAPPGPSEQPNLWGITFVASDLEGTKAFLGDNLSKLRKAKQAGRQIATLRNNNLGMNVAIALMTPHTSKANL
ncbi:Glyoxalase, partial [Durusdinium trenchii]